MFSKYFYSLIYFPLVLCGDCPSLISDFSQDKCIAESQTSEKSFYYDLDVNNCIPKCKSYQDEIRKNCASDRQCMPGYFCDKRCGADDDLINISCENNNDCPDNTTQTCTYYCAAEKKESCMAYHINTDDYKDTYWSAIRFKPSCNNDGTWKAKQCKGGVYGRCLCFDGQGNRLFGEALYKESANMTCACSRRKLELSNTRNTTLHCDSMGNFEPLQCDMVSQQCYCLDPKTGDLISAFVPLKAINLLPCYSVDTYGSQYLRQCESKKYAQTRIKQKLKTHGITYVTEDFLLCNDDGSYGAFTIEKDNAYCTLRNNSKIGPWQSDIQSGYENLNCNCARDYYKYGHNQVCLSTGNYKALQQDEDNWYCVDKDGFAKSGLFTKPDSTTDDSYCSQFY